MNRIRIGVLIFSSLGWAPLVGLTSLNAVAEDHTTATVQLQAQAEPQAKVGPNELSLVIGGEAYGGAPEFIVRFNGTPIGKGTVSVAIDSDTKGRFEDAPNKTEYVQDFNFPIPETLFSPNGKVTVSLTNEAHGSVGSGRERALYLDSVTINGARMAATEFSAQSRAGAEPTPMIGPYLVLATNGTKAILDAPQAGWPAPKSDVAQITTEAPGVTNGTVKAPSPAAAAPRKLAEAVVATPEKPAVTSPAVAPVVSADKPKALPVVPADKPAKIAALEAKTPPDTAKMAMPETDRAATGEPHRATSRCALDTSFHVLGFGENSNALTARVKRELDGVARKIGSQKCVVRVTGYSSTEGSYANNALFSVERARNALHYLRTKGVKFVRFSAAGVGETSQFGAAPGLNRRVVIKVRPENG